MCSCDHRLRTRTGQVAYTNATHEDYVMSEDPTKTKTDEEDDVDQVDPTATDPSTDPVAPDQPMPTAELEDADEAAKTETDEDPAK